MTLGIARTILVRRETIVIASSRFGYLYIREEPR